MIEIRQLNKRYGDTVALRDVSLTIHANEIFGFIGPDGSGKTTLLRIIATLLLPDSGTVLVDNRDVVRDFTHIRQSTGYVPGEFALYHDLTVNENLQFFADLFNADIGENLPLFRDVYRQLEPFGNRRVEALSGGMKQKLALCCALVHRPSLLILDEPTTGVDAISRSEFWEILANLKTKGVTILVSTPYMDEANLCDSIALMHKGAPLDVGKPAEMLHNFHGTVYEISCPTPYDVLKKLRGVAGFENAFPFGQSVHLFTSRDIGPHQVMKTLEAIHHTGIGVRKVSPTIEDYFLQRMMEIETTPYAGS